MFQYMSFCVEDTSFKINSNGQTKELNKLTKPNYILDSKCLY